MSVVYVYVMDTMADWELGHVMSELKSRRFFKKDAPEVTVKTVGKTTDPVMTMGGLTILPDCVLDEIEMNEQSMLLLPGADTWNDPKHVQILKKAEELLDLGAGVAAICGATAALANMGLINNRPHTSNGAGFLEMFCPGYQGSPYYVNEASVRDGNLITAGSTGGLMLARQVIEYLGVFKEETLSAWYAYFSTGDAGSFFALMQSLQ